MLEKVEGVRTRAVLGSWVAALERQQLASWVIGLDTSATRAAW